MARLRQARTAPLMAPGEPTAGGLAGVWRDVRYALRLAAHEPLFAGLVVATLTLGIGSSTSMFAVVDGVLLEPLPYRDPASLVWMYGAFQGSDSAAVSPPDFVDYRREGAVFERLAAMTIAPAEVTVAGAGAPERRRASYVSSGMFGTLGLPPVLGRDFTPQDESIASPAIAISQRVWQERFGRSPEVIGRPLLVDGRPRTVVAVLPAGFVLPYDGFIDLAEPVDLLLPLPLDDAEAQVRRFHWLRLIGRLHPGVSLRKAQSWMDGIAARLASAYPENETWRLRLVPLRERVVGDVRPRLLILTAAVALLLVVSCANVAGLLLARASVRESELAVRGALGASRGRIVRQLVVEGLLWSSAAGACGLLLTWWTVRWLKLAGPAQFPRLEAVAVSPRVAAFALAASAITTLIFALVPAVHAAYGELAGALRPARTATRDRSRRAGQRALVVAQLAVSLVLLAGAALLVRGFVGLVSVDVGFDPAGVIVVRAPLPAQRYGTGDRIDGFNTALLERLDATPEIEAAALGSAPPMTGANDSTVYREGQPPASPDKQRFAQVRWIQGDYFAALGIPLLSGRTFDGRVDRPGAAEVAIVSRQAAREYFGNEDPLGQRLTVDLGAPVEVEVIGVTGDVRIFGPANQPPPMLYLHARQHPMTNLQVVVRSRASTGEVAAVIRGHVQALDPTLAVSRVQRMEALLADSVAQPRFSTLLITSFAGFAVLLTLVGLYGTLSYLVARREREFGIRLAIGATRRDIRRMVLGQAAVLVGLGIAVGLVAAFLTTRLASSLLVDTSPADPQVLAGVAAGSRRCSGAAGARLGRRRPGAGKPRHARRAGGGAARRVVGQRYSGSVPRSSSALTATKR